MSNKVRRLGRERRPEPVPDAKRTEWVTGALRTHGLRLLPDEDRRMAWSIEWRRYEAGDGPLPIDPDTFARALEAWPSRAGYSRAVTTWQPPRPMRPYDPLEYLRSV